MRARDCQAKLCLSQSSYVQNAYILAESWRDLTAGERCVTRCLQDVTQCLPRVVALRNNMRTSLITHRHLQDPQIDHSGEVPSFQLGYSVVLQQPGICQKIEYSCLIQKPFSLVLTTVLMNTICFVTVPKLDEVVT